ncbi:MAG TPA: TonB-dependent receptor plug domain-containing protein, partial [Aestuariivirga sp.]|nr:TonB-dependent receptor plug domain-containing protein [Aestuariivirga sp.]
MKTFSFLLALGAGAAAIMGVGQAEPIDLGTIEVIANRSATADAKVGSTVNRVSQQEIKTRAQPSVADYLATLPGVSVSAPGGVGQETTLIVRGADKKYVKTLFNGIDISDVTATQVQPSIEHFMADGVSAIEVLKGSQGTLYGSDAVAGVIGISTLGEPEDGLHAELGAEGGSHSTFRSHAKVTAAGNGGKMALGVSGLNTAGISAAEEHAGNPERDGYKNFGLTFAGEQQMNDVLTLFGSALSISSTADYDDDGAPPRDNPFNETSGARQGARIGAKLNLLDGRVENIVSAQVFNTDRDIHSVSIFGPYDANFDGTRTKIDDQLTFTVNDSVKLLAGADHEWQSAAITDNYGTAFNARAHNGGLQAEAIVAP